MKAGFTAVLALALALALAAAGGAGCGRGGKDSAPAGGRAATGKPGAAPAADARPAGPGRGASAAGDSAARPAGGIGGIPDARGPVQIKSAEGAFTAFFPDGCNRVHTRVMPAGAQPGQVQSVSVWSDRFGRKGEGVMVSTLFKLRDENSGPPGPATVVAQIEEVLKSFGLQAAEQHPVARNGLQGVRVLCRDSANQGVMWIEGLLAGDRVYILSGWRSGGGTLSDRQIADFFVSFQVR